MCSRTKRVKTDFNWGMCYVEWIRSDPRILSPFRLKGVMRTLLQLQKENCLLWTEVNDQVFTWYFFFSQQNRLFFHVHALNRATRVTIWRNPTRQLGLLTQYSQRSKFPQWYGILHSTYRRTEACTHLLVLRLADLSREHTLNALAAPWADSPALPFFPLPLFSHLARCLETPWQQDADSWKANMANSDCILGNFSVTTKAASLPQIRSAKMNQMQCSRLPRHPWIRMHPRLHF